MFRWNWFLYYSDRFFERRSRSTHENEIDAGFFDYVIEVSDQELQDALKLVANFDLVLALVDAPKEVLEKIQMNISRIAAELISEDIEKAKTSGTWAVGDQVHEIDTSAEAIRAARARAFRAMRAAGKTARVAC